MPSHHAVLSPSSSERWITCPGSVRASMHVPRQPASPYAAEGTVAHALGEIELLLALGDITASQHTRKLDHWRKSNNVSVDTEAEMAGHIERYVDLVLEQADSYPGSQVFVEQRVSTGVPSCWGTSDTVIVSPNHVEIIDLKYGMGVRVRAAGNPQLRLYGVGALEQIGQLFGDPHTVTTRVFQPRLHHNDAETVTAEDLIAWRDSLIPIAESALGEDAPFNPSEDACRWCPVAGECRARRDWAVAQDFSPEPALLSPEELAEALAIVPEVEAWASAVRKVALEKAYNDRITIPGYKVVRGNGRRSIRNEEQAINSIVEAGYSLKDASTTKIKGIGALEKLLGDDFNPLLGEFVTKSEGNPALVPDSDPRHPIDRSAEIAEDFKEE